MMKPRLLLLALLLACGVVTHQGIAADADEHIRRFILFDPVADAVLRQQELAKLRRRADRGEAWAQADLGSLYRLGAEHPAKLLPRDDAQAEVYLSNAAAGGILHAMAGMAELELSRGQAYEALLWTQLFTHYAKAIPGQDSKNPEKAKVDEAYQAFLMKRCYGAVGSGLDEQALRADLDAFVARHDARIRETLAKNKAPDDSARLRTLPGSWGKPYHWSLLRLPPKSSAQVRYLVGVSAEGRIERLLVLDGLPDTVAAERMSQWVVEGGRFNTDDAGRGLRWAQLPLYFSDQAYGFKAEPPQ